MHEYKMTEAQEVEQVEGDMLTSKFYGTMCVFLKANSSFIASIFDKLSKDRLHEFYGHLLECFFGEYS